MNSQFLANRLLGIGGSDAASLLNIGYGCRRRLWYEKRSTPKDFSEEISVPMELGHLLEPYVALRYEKTTGHKLSSVGQSIHPHHDFLRVHMDREIDVKDREPGVFEAKSVGRAMFYKILREGLPIDYIAQQQHAFLVTGYTWGAYGVVRRDSDDLLLWAVTGKEPTTEGKDFLHWEVPRNDTVCEAILDEAPKFWALVENGPAPDALDPDDRRCQSCAWRRTCQGDALVQLDGSGEMPQAEELRPLLTEYDERKELYGQASSLYDDTKEQIAAVLGDRQAVMVGDRKVYFRPAAGKTLIKGKELLKAYRDACRYIADLVTMGTHRAEQPVLPRAETFIDTSKPSRPLRIF